MDRIILYIFAHLYKKTFKLKITRESIQKHYSCLLWCILAVLFGVHPSLQASPQRERTLLIINSYNEGAPWSQDLIVPVMSQVAAMDGVEVNVVHMNGTYIRNDSLLRRTEEGIFRRFQNRKPDYLFLIGNLAFLLRDRIKAEWGEEIPMVLVAHMDTYAPEAYYYTGRSRRMPGDAYHSLSSIRDQYNFTFIEARSYYRETVDLMVRLLPGMQKLVFAADDFYLNQRYDRLIQQYVAEKYPHLTYERLVAKDGADNELQDYLLAGDPTVGVLFSTWFYERKDLLGNSMQITGDFQLVSTSRLPVFSLRSAYVTRGGFVGGYFYDPNEVRQSVASAVGQMLDGRAPRDIPFAYSKHIIPILNWQEMVQDDISPDLCPPGTVFINRPPSFWEQYRLQLIIGITLLLALGCIVVVYQLMQRKRIAILSAFDKLVRNMPVSYAKGKVIFDRDGKPSSIEYYSGNTVFHALCRDNGLEAQISHMLRFVEIVLLEERTVSFNYYFKATDTYYDFIICPSSEPDTVDIFGMDITAQQKAELSLRELNKKLELTLSVARIIPWRWDLKNNKISCEAQRILKHLNFRKEEGSTSTTHIINPQEYLQKIHPDDLPRIQQAYIALTDGTRSHVREEFRILSEIEGRQHTDWFEVNVMADQHDRDGKPVALAGSMLLITERKKQEHALIVAREQAKESDRLKSAFLANMSHEIRTPLNTIVGFSGLLATTEDEQEKKEFINIIENNNDLLLQLISDVLDLAKVEANTLEFNYQTVDMNDLMHNIENTVSRRLQPGVELKMVCERPEGLLVNTERNRLSQVFINLLTNACKFTSKGNITFGYELRGEDLYCYVRDTGLGISHENQTKIFERFAKLDSFAQGTGLGLSICQSIIGKMKGKLGVESEGEGRGSLFWFTIPYIPGKAGTDVVEVTKPREVVKKTITIMVAEDNESNYLLFKSILGKEYHLIHAWDGEEAVELYRKHTPNIVIMDINMPKMDGYEATREIRKLSAHVPIIAVTAYAFASDKERILQNGFNGYVSKPVNANELRNEILSTINRCFILM